MIILLLANVGFMLTMIVLFQAKLLKKTHLLEKDSRLSGRFHVYIPYFICIGMGFMLVEILLTKRFSFYLGYPHLNIAIIIFTILKGAGYRFYIVRKTIREYLSLKKGEAPLRR